MTREDVALYYKSEMDSAKRSFAMSEQQQDVAEMKHYRGVAERAEWAYRALSIDYERMIAEIDDYQADGSTSADSAAGAEKALDIMKKYVGKYVDIGDK